MAVGFLVGSASESLSGVTTGASWVELGMGMDWGCVCLRGFSGGRLGLP